jgi:glycosyltransferase involved in cell wall biosynthesis
MPDVPSASVVVSAYNRPDYLIRALQGFARQTRTDFEIVLADDGSSEESRAAVDAHLQGSKLNWRRVWHEDDGFRKTTILNKAVAEARADYLIFTDGDCIPFPDLVALHLALRRPGHFLSAGAVRLSPPATAYILSGGLDESDFFQWDKLKAIGQPARFKFARMFAPAAARRLMDVLIPVKRTFNGLNASCWKADWEKVGGFNEAMGYGSEDVEFGIRLEAAGVKPIRVRHRIRALHLDHDRPYAPPQEVERNRAITEATRRSLRSGVQN